MVNSHKYVEVYFRDVFKSAFTTGPYHYKYDGPVEIGDIVLVKTKFGLSVGQVGNFSLEKPNINVPIKPILEVCKTKYPLPPKGATDVQQMSIFAYVQD